MPAIFSDHMVLEKKAVVPIWGTATAGETVAVTLDSASGRATAGADGKWHLDLNLANEGPGPFEMVVEGSNKVKIEDVAIGDVWLASGQSNMTMNLSETAGAKDEIAKSADPMLRTFLVTSPDTRPSNEPQVVKSLEGKWVVAGPETSGSFSAIAYYFGKSVRAKVQVPVGIVHSSVGGSAIESWISPAGFDRDPDLKAAKDNLLPDFLSYPARLADYQAKYHAWEAQYNRQDQPTADAQVFAAPGVSLDDYWKPVTLPGDLAKQGLPDSGVVWLRRQVTITDSAAGHYLVLNLGNLRDLDQVYWNGTLVGQTTADASTCTFAAYKATNDRRYDVPGTLVHAGQSVLTIRLFSPAGNAGVDGNTVIDDSVGWRPEAFVGGWMAKSEFELPAPSDAAKAAYPARPLHPPAEKEIPSRLFTSMIEPLIPYGLRGFLWYQGNANEARAYQYRAAFKILIQDWRAAWNDDTLPFYFCQLENTGWKSNLPNDNGASELREAQSMALTLPATGQAVLIDLGEEANVHYKDKKDAGERLAAVALANTYGQSVPSSGPVFQSMSVEETQIRVTFQKTDGGLVAKPLPDTYQPNSTLPETKPLIKNSPVSELEGFSICGDDHKWVWANASIDGNSIVVSSPEVAKPVAVRYAWSGNPTCNLYNGVGLPASPFRTDDFPTATLNVRYGK